MVPWGPPLVPWDHLAVVPWGRFHSTVGTTPSTPPPPPKPPHTWGPPLLPLVHLVRCAKKAPKKATNARKKCRKKRRTRQTHQYPGTICGALGTTPSILGPSSCGALGAIHSNVGTSPSTLGPSAVPWGLPLVPWGPPLVPWGPPLAPFILDRPSPLRCSSYPYGSGFNSSGNLAVYFSYHSSVIASWVADLGELGRTQ